MSNQNSQFPDQIVLNGADYFLLQLDRIMLRTSGRNNVCTFVVSLENRLDLEDLKLHLSDNPAYQWITRLRIRSGLPFSLIKWVFDENLQLPNINQFQLTDEMPVLESLLAANIQVESQSPFKVDLIQLHGVGSKLIFTWHHVLMDAHGGESFIHLLGLGKSINNTGLLRQEGAKLPLKQRAQIAQAMKKFLYDTSQLPLLSLYAKKHKKKSDLILRYRVVSFSEHESLIINDMALQNGAGFLLSAFYLAATTNSIAHIQQQRGLDLDDVLVPVPLDRRKKGVNGSVIGNQVTFLFYRIPKQMLSDVQVCTTELIEQMKKLMRSDSPNHYLIMMDFLRRVPGVFYRLMLRKPTEGLMASFFYSDTGDSLQDYDQLFDRSIESAVHYPPVMYPPGMTFVFSRFRGALQITFGYMEQVINEQEVDQLLTRLRSTLLAVEKDG